MGIDILTAFMFKDSSNLVFPVFFGKTSNNWVTVNDGFMWRDNTNSCLDFILTASNKLSDDNGDLCIFKPSVTLTNSYDNPKPNCNSGSGGT